MLKLISATLLFLAVLPATAQDQRLFMLDFIFMDEGFTLADRDAYNAEARPIASRHGVELQATLDLQLMMLGPGALDRVDLWTLPGAEALGAWAADPDYVKLRPEADAIHDMDQLTLYLGLEVAPPNLPPGFYYLELFAFNTSQFDGEDFVGYTRESDTIAQQYGITRAASFSKLTKVLGNGPETHWMNLYALPSEEAFKAWGRDAGFAALQPVRDRIFDLSNSVLAVMQVR